MADRSTEHLPLGAEFAAASRDDWLRLVSTVLKGASYDQKLVGRTYDGLRIDALHERVAQARPLPGRAPAAPWQVLQRVAHPDPGVANAQALEDLDNGATGLMLVFAGAVGAYGYGIDASEAALSRVLDGVHLDAGIALEFDLSPQTKDAPHRLAALLQARKVSPDAVDIRFGYDPLGALAAAGTSPLRWGEIAPLFARLIAELAGQGFKGPFAAADARPVHAAGGSEAQELAFALASAVAYLRALEAGGVALDVARRMIFFRLAADADQFLTIAKFRAMRKLWACVEEACGLVPEPAFVSAETAWRMMTRRDPWVNMLRTTVATFAAGIDGANAITALPFTAALGLPDRFARRVARNMQLLLLEESNLAKVSDPVAGAGGIEDLTAQLCEAAWALFQDIETAGGPAGALERGLIQRNVAAVRAEREKAVAVRRDALTGTSEFPHLAEAPVSVLDVAPVTTPALPATHTVEPLTARRLAEPFERLRDASDHMLDKTGARPRVFLANLGRLADFTTRATFAKNFFDAGGIEAVTREGPANPDDLAAAFAASGAKLACLCATDAVYAREAEAAATALAAAGAKHIYLAGRPGSMEQALRAAGVQAFIYAGCDALATLRHAHGILGTE
jgi:methylmalonyl-CoA mutase